MVWGWKSISILSSYFINLTIKLDVFITCLPPPPPTHTPKYKLHESQIKNLVSENFLRLERKLVSMKQQNTIKQEMLEDNKKLLKIQYIKSKVKNILKT